MSIQIDDVMWALLILTALSLFFVIGGALGEWIIGRRKRKWWEP